ncbi:MAG: hypothetical protein ACI9EF_003649 [Pseudohongiellaceae bacterium]|jgi:hypothetical protein
MKTSALLVLLMYLGCGTVEVRKSSSAVDYLFPEGAPASAPRDVTLRLPVRVGIAFAPGGQSSRYDALTQLDQVHTAQTIPAQSLHVGGSFAEIDQLGGSATSLDTLPELLRDATKGLAESTDELLVNLGAALTAFEKQISSGTVRGPGTPAIEVFELNGL